MNLSATCDVKSFLDDMHDVQREQLPFAAMQALNFTARWIRRALVEEADRVFDRPTPYTRAAIQVLEMATKTSPVAVIGVRESQGKGVDPDKYLAPEVEGGGRNQKRSERALASTGMLLPGDFTSPGGGANLDAYGNMRGSDYVKLLSALQAFGEQGYRANATTKTLAKRAKIGRTKEGYKVINGIVYFVSRGKGSYARGSGERYQPLPAGVYTKSGIHGVIIKSVLKYIKAPTYRKRFDFYGKAERIWASDFGPNFRDAMAKAVATAK